MSIVTRRSLSSLAETGVRRMRVPRLPRVTLEGLCYITMLGFLLAGALIRQINLLLALFALLAGLPLVNRWMVWATLCRSEVERRIPRSTSAGDLLMVELEVSNPQKRLASWAVTVDDQIRRQRRAAQRRHDFGPHLVPLHSCAWMQPWSPVPRTDHAGGRYEFGPLRLWTRFPFGMIRGESVIQEPQSLLVLPQLGRLTRRWQRLHTIGGSRHQQRAAPAGFARRGFLRPARLAFGR